MSLPRLIDHANTEESTVYQYEVEKSRLFTEDGQVMFLKIRDNVDKLLNANGAVRSQEAMSGVTGDGWVMLACLDRLVELGELRRIYQEHVAGQHQIFVRNF